MEDNNEAFSSLAIFGEKKMRYGEREKEREREREGERERENKPSTWGMRREFGWGIGCARYCLVVLRGGGEKSRRSVQ